MDGIDPSAFKYAVGLISDGDVFERFCLDFLAKILGHEFIPAGGIRDRGIDGFEYTFYRTQTERVIYQLSIQKDFKGKINDTAVKLKENRIKYDQLVYVTNVVIKSKDTLIDELFDKFKKPVVIYDIDWLMSHANDSEGTIRSYKAYVDSSMNEFNRPGKSYTVANLDKDPRVYVFLRQLVEERHESLGLDKILVDSLIIFALDETDPETGVFLKRNEIIDRINKLISFEPVVLEKLIDERLRVLSQKPRRINYYTDKNAYCLRLEERISIQNRNLNDLALFEEFMSDTRNMINAYKQGDEEFKNILLQLILEIVNSIFYKQGIEFADFVIHGSKEDVVEKSLTNIISGIVDRRALPGKDKQEMKVGLLSVIRNIVYIGTKSQREFLNRLSRTYVMLLLLQCEPKLCTYFGTMASKLRIYVCTSIIIPAMSEQFLDEKNRRFSNLLTGAIKAGVKLYINEAILDELVAHLHMIKNLYKQKYEGLEEVYTDELSVIYVRELMIRAFFYSRIRGQVNTFDEYIGRFVSPRLREIQDDMVEWLKSTFGIEYLPNSSLGIHLDKDEIGKIERELTKYKGKTDKGPGAKYRARNDAQVMLTIHARRDMDNETGQAGIFGYKTWWLSRDVTTQKAAVDAAGSKYKRTCYMRPDFLYNYISMAPEKGEVDETFGKMFPSLIGVKLSWELPDIVDREVHDFISAHKEIQPNRMKAIIRELADDLKQKPDKINEKFLKAFLQEHEPKKK
jgi:hypothetical protein